LDACQVDGRNIVVRVRSEPPNKDRGGGGGAPGGMPPAPEDAKLYVAFLPNEMDDARFHDLFRRACQQNSI